MATGDVCSAGFVCPPGTMFPQQHPCPVGTWSSIVGAQNLSSCWLCPPGLYCNSTGLNQPSGVCSSGYYCSGGAVSAMPSDGEGAQLCPAGHYCLGGGVEGILPCPPGTYSPQLGLSQVEQCLICPAGSEGGICPRAHYCPEGSANAVPCPAGTYSNLTGQSACSRCPAGYYCAGKTDQFTQFPCPPGFYCPDGIRKI
ncbi:hypothetical protein D4764_12G0006470 [Takifugu flavidus]|uniref:Uncharacterized protein n=1 Tax=Takifugu flavidus TaxID=433684 RepID=A0A5C6PFZ2_9TELE|nr:hypothetical protein D4764_12G0006470 [Takifugu flavidus]